MNRQDAGSISPGGPIRDGIPDFMGISSGYDTASKHCARLEH